MRTHVHQFDVEILHHFVTSDPGVCPPANTLKLLACTSAGQPDRYGGTHGDLSGFSDTSALPIIGSQVTLYWPIDWQFYPGEVSDITDNGSGIVHYDDGDRETLQFSD